MRNVLALISSLAFVGFSSNASAQEAAGDPPPVVVAGEEAVPEPPVVDPQASQEPPVAQPPAPYSAQTTAPGGGPIVQQGGFPVYGNQYGVQPGAAPARSRAPFAYLIGWIVMAGGWVFSALVGALMWSGAATPPGSTCLNCDTVGPMLMIPIIGPWLAFPDSDGDDGKAIAATLGIIQDAGLIAGIIGTIFYASYDTSPPTQPGVSVGIGPGSASLTARF